MCDMTHPQVLGVLGAIDPHSVKMLDFAKKKGAGGLLAGPSMAVVAAAGERKGANTQDTETLPGPSSDDYYPTITVFYMCLTRVFTDCVCMRVRVGVGVGGIVCVCV